MFQCRCCPEKEIRIAELKEQVAYFKLQHEVQIEYFKQLLNPKPRVVSRYEAEEDMVLDGGSKEEISLPQDIPESVEVLAERERMLSGSY